MREPGTIKCDLCGATIAHESRIVRITVPLPADLRQEIAKDVEARAPKSFMGFIPVFRIVPEHWTLEACGCILGLLRDIPRLVAEDVQRAIARRQHHEEQEPVASLEDL